VERICYITTAEETELEPQAVLDILRPNLVAKNEKT